jgi:RNA recognition motif-containing protein
MLSIQVLLIAGLLASTQSYSFVPTRFCGDITTSTTFSFSPTQRNFLEMKVSKGKSKHSKGNSLHTINQNRKRIAGRPGNKHFLDPNKVFIGNLSFDATVEDVKGFLKNHLGGLHTVESVKIIRDWKTNKSKGYGFVQFIEPMLATSAMQSIKNKKLKGRVIRLDQGRKKDDLNNRVLFVKKRERKDVDEESKVIDSALDEVEATSDETEKEYSLDDFENDEDALLFGDDEDDEDSEFDGWFEEVYGGSKWEELTEEESKNMNREQKRKAQRLKPRKKLPAKGFGVQIP